MGEDDYADGGFVADEFETNGHFYIPPSGTNSTLSFDALGVPFDLDARQTGPAGIGALLTSPEYRNWSLTGGVEGTGDTTGYNLGVAFNFLNVPRFMEDILSRGKVTAAVEGQFTPGADSLRRSIAAEGQFTPELLNLAVNAGMGRTGSGRRDFNVGARLPVGDGTVGASYNRQLNSGAQDSSNSKVDLSYPMFGGIINAYANRAKAEGSPDRDSMGASYNKGNFSADVSTSPEETRAMLNYSRPFADGGVVTDPDRTYPTKEDAEFGRLHGAFYGDPNRGKFDQDEFKTRQFNPRGKPQDFVQDENIPQKLTPRRMREGLYRSALASRRSALAGLGFDPSNFAYTHQILNTSGQYNPTRDIGWASTAVSAPVHESIHRGIAMLDKRGLLTPREKRQIKSWNEMIARRIMDKEMGGVEEAELKRILGPNYKKSIGYKQIIRSRGIQGLDSLIKSLEKKASNLSFKMGRRGGPR